VKFRIRVQKKETGAKIEQFMREDVGAEELVRRFQGEGYLVLSVQDPTTAKAGFFPFFKRQKGKKTQLKQPKKISGITLFEKVSGSELLSFFVQLIALLRAGIPILRALSIIEQGLHKGLLKKIILATSAKISQGYNLSNALADFPKVFPSFWFGLIEAGEASGTLPDVLAEIQKYQETSEKFKRKLISALVYPIILICFCIAAVIIFMVKVIPTFEKVFTNSIIFGGNKKLPQITQFVLDTSRFFQANIAWILLGIAAIVTIYAYMNRRRKTKKYLDQVRLQIPVVKTFLMEIAIVRFSRGLGTMIKAGIPIIRALEIASRLVGNVVIEDRIELAKEDVKKGNSTAQALEKHHAFPVFVTQLIAVGEETGSLDKFLEVVAQFHEERVDATITRLSTMIEPMIILFMGIVVGTLVISMFLPLIEISTGGH